MAFMREVKTAEDAKNQWKAFFQRYENIGVDDDKSIPKSIEEIKQPSFKITIRQETKTDAEFVPIKPNDKHTPEFIYFLNNDNNDKRILRSTNQEELSLLSEALRLGNWNDRIFRVPRLAYLAIGLYEDQRITTQQFFSLLDFNQTKRYLTNIQFYPILDEDGKFTYLANVYLFHIFKKLNMTMQDRENFRMLLLALPPSERVFYLTDMVHQYESFSLGGILIGTRGAFKKNDKLIRLPFGAEDALGLARHGEEYVRVFLRLGDFDREAVEYGVKHHFRPGAIYFPYILTNDTVHTFREVLPTVKTDHDRHHARVLSGTPRYIREAFWNMTALFRLTFGFPWSKEIWDQTDFDYRFMYLKTLNPQILTSEKTALFCSTLWDGSLSTEPDFSQGGYIFMVPEEVKKSKKPLEKCLTAPGAAFFVDLIEHSEAWAKLDIDPTHFTEPFKRHFDTIKSHYSIIKDRDHAFTLLHCLLYFALESIHAEGHFPLLSKVLFDHRNQFGLQFKKFTLKKAAELRTCEHTIYAESKGMVLNSYHRINHRMKNFLVQAGKESYKKAVFEHKLTVAESKEYFALRDRGITDAAAIYLLKPGFINWFAVNPCRNTLLCLTLVGLPLAYSYDTCCSKNASNKSAQEDELVLIDSKKTKVDSLADHQHFGLLSNDSKPENEAFFFRPDTLLTPA